MLKKYFKYEKKLELQKITIYDYNNIYVVNDAKLLVGSLYINSYSLIIARYDIILSEHVHIYDHNH